MDTNILLESGTNELEVLEFTLGNNHYGINVAKIREILTYQPVTPVPNSHPSIEGIFMPRDTMISVVNLKRCLGMPDDAKTEGLGRRSSSRMPRSIPSRTAPRPVSSRWMTS